jgi:protein tyrosine phosphatase (PTP) superfamily phosphohydrolase (DUF442 family)
LILVTLALMAAVIFRKPLFEGNFGIVDPGRVYRSAQPGGDLSALIAAKRLGSILNLRGGSSDDPFYVNEVQATRASGVDFYDFPISATRRPTRRELLVLIDLLGRCRYPLLIHCKQGSDRTGLVSALYLMAVRGVAPEQAGEMFTVRYGHIPLLGTQRLHEPLDEYSAWLNAHRLAHTPDRLRSWVESEYKCASPNQTFRALKTGPRDPSPGHALSSSSSPTTRRR